MQAVHLINDMSVLGGTSVTAPDLCNALADYGLDVKLFTAQRGPVDTSAFRFTYREFPSTNYLRGLAISGAMRRALEAAASEPLIVHGHSMWSMSTVYPSWVSRKKRNARSVIAPHGTLAPFALRWRWWRKAPFWYAAQKRALETCDCLHSTGHGESQDFRALGLKQPIANIPNPIFIPQQHRRAADSSRLRRLMFLGRMHPIKGLDTLLRSWRQVQTQFPGWEVQLAGPPQYVGYREELINLATDLGCERVSFHDGVPNLQDAKFELYDQADLFILPSHSEGFGLVVAEALSHGLPAIVCKGAPWSGLVEHDCGWWVDHGEAPIAEALREAMSLEPAELAARGQRGRNWVESEFSARRVAQMMNETYIWLLGGGTPPAWISL